MLDFILPVANAQDAVAQTQSGLMQFLPLIFIFVIFYFLMIRPQQKRMKQEQAMIDALKKGDEVYTKSGMIGTITGLTDKVATLEISEGVKVKFIRSQIGGLASDVYSTTEQK